MSETLSHLMRSYSKDGIAIMGCKKKKSSTKTKAARFKCEDCGAVAKAKDDVCDPKKIKKKKKKK